MTDWESDYWELLFQHAALWALVAEMVGVGGGDD